jgi:hypothetical protein
MSKQKQQGTNHESWIVAALKAVGIEARRLAEGGANDEGDVEILLNGERWILEAKSRQTLNVQEALGKSRRKASGARVALVWKRLVKVAGFKNRQPVAGERVVVILGWDDFLHLTGVPKGMTQRNTVDYNDVRGENID